MATVKLLTLGNSLVAGYTAPPGFRRVMHDGLLVGIQPTDTIDMVGPYTDASGWSDNQHAGNSGDTIAQIKARVIADTYIATYVPNIVVIEGGTNDLIGAALPATVAASMDDLINTLYGYDANLYVFVLELPLSPQGCVSFDPTLFAAKGRAFNKLLPGVVKGQRALGRQCWRVRINHLFDCKGECTDGSCYSALMTDTYHPNTEGFYAIGIEAWKEIKRRYYPTLPRP